MSFRITFTALAAALVCSAPALAKDLTAVSFGGANRDAQIKAFNQPYEQKTGVKIIAGEYNGELAKVKAMVDTGSISWDLVEVESPELARGCDEGLFEELDFSKLGNKEDFVKGAITPCGVGFFVWSTVLAYNADKLKTAPKGWVDFWDTKTFPGKRGLRKGAKYTLEFALMADGVSTADLYKVLGTKEGQDRAFKKLDELKPHIQWWEAGAQPPQYLASGDVVMSSAYNGRIASVQKERNLKIVWDGGIYDFDAWAIPKGSKSKEDAMKFLAFTLQAPQQKAYSEQIAYGPSNKQAIALLDEKTASNLPTAEKNIAGQVAMGVQFWTDFGESLEQRFNAWAAK